MFSSFRWLHSKNENLDEILLNRNKKLLMYNLVCLSLDNCIIFPLCSLLHIIPFSAFPLLPFAICHKGNCCMWLGGYGDAKKFFGGFLARGPTRKGGGVRFEGHQPGSFLVGFEGANPEVFWRGWGRGSKKFSKTSGLPPESQETPKNFFLHPSSHPATHNNFLYDYSAKTVDRQTR